MMAPNVNEVISGLDGFVDHSTSVSRLEQRSDLLLSTLRRTVEAMGGSLSLIATFPDRPPVELSGISERESGN